MPLPKDEFEKGIKSLEKGSLESMILEFLIKAKKTDTPAYTINEIMDSFDARKGDPNSMVSLLVFLIALNNLEKSGKIVSREVKEEISGKTTLYCMAK